MSGRGTGSAIGAGVGGVGGFLLGGPLGALAGASLGGMVGGEIGDSADGSPEQEALQQALHDAQANTEQYRMQARADRERTLQQQVGLYGPVNDLLAKMYGPEFALDLSQFEPSRFAPSRVLGNELPIAAAAAGAPADLGYDPTIQPASGSQRCKVCGFGPEHVVHTESDRPNFHNWQAPDAYDPSAPMPNVAIQTSKNPEPAPAPAAKPSMRDPGNNMLPPRR